MLYRIVIICAVILAGLSPALARGGGGCFLGDTPILRGDGTSAPIREIRPGDVLLAFSEDGRTVTAAVQNVIAREVGEYLAVDAGGTRVLVTPEHPFYVGHGAFKTMESLAAGDQVYVYDGQGLSPQPIEGIRRIREPAVVYNLQTDQPHTFFASGIAVHNKGGGGGGGGHGGGGGSHGGGGYHGGGYHSTGGGSSDAGTVLAIIGIVFGIFILIAVVSAIAKSKSRAEQNLDYSYSQAAVAPKADKTMRLLEFIARQDPAVNTDALKNLATSTFTKLQQCWQGRDYEPMKDLLMPDLYALHCGQLQSLARNHEINLIESLAVERVDLVNVRYTLKPDNREFTALISARACDYYIDDRTKAFLRGDEGPQPFQEFWTFQMQAGRWLLREIEQARESDVLKDENFFEEFTDRKVGLISGGDSGKGGPAGPWLDNAAQVKATKIERMLNFLVQTDKLWDRQQMLQRARDVFMNVYAARESSNVNAIRGDDLFGDLAVSLRQEIAGRLASGVTVEFRNLCIRKVELILVRNYSDNGRDEFFVRISAHAQQIVRKAGRQTAADPDVMPFEEYWTFGRQGNAWKLKEVLPKAQGEKALAEENLDEDSSPAQIQWYYRQTRAN